MIHSANVVYSLLDDANATELICEHEMIVIMNGIYSNLGINQIASLPSPVFSGLTALQELFVDLMLLEKDDENEMMKKKDSKSDVISCLQFGKTDAHRMIVLVSTASITSNLF